jgi:hypothetical protein
MNLPDHHPNRTGQFSRQAFTPDYFAPIQRFKPRTSWATRLCYVVAILLLLGAINLQV